MKDARAWRQVVATAAATSVCWLAWFAVVAPAQDMPTARAPGGGKTAKTRTLEAGAKALQRKGPLAGFDMYLDGFHAIKDRADLQMEAHHFCRQVNEDFAQCVLFDGNGRDAKLDGIEYIISAKLFETLPVEERKYWHPHNGEILSGQLVAPGIPKAAEKALMKDRMNSYGKTWHVWHTGLFGQDADALPLGPPMLAWSFSRDGEALETMVRERDRRLGVETTARRRERRELGALAQPQWGVDDMKDTYGRPTTPIPGVTQAR